MARFGTAQAAWLRWATLVLWMSAGSLVGCGKPADQAVENPAADPLPTAQATSASTPASDVEPRRLLTFAEATRSEPPGDGSRPPDLTMTGKSVGKLYTEVIQTWDAVQLSSQAGKALCYTATIDTQLGLIEIALRPDLAPNHVRNFVALARVGYYDGLVFERTVRAQSEGQPDLELIEAGCPIGTGELGVGSLGYWLKPEFNDATHEEGTVGACHGEEPDTACCKFYLTLSKAPYLDKSFTVFGKVTHGLDVARRIFSLPVRNDPDYPEGDRPENPVVMRKVTIRAHEVEKPDTPPGQK